MAESLLQLSALKLRNPCWQDHTLQGILTAINHKPQDLLRNAGQAVSR
jgi:hypothetical protein